MKQTLFNILSWGFDALESIIKALRDGLKWLHEDIFRLVTTYPKETTFFLEFLLVFLVALLIIMANRKPQAAAPEASKLASTKASWKINWKPIGIGVAVVLALVAVVGVVS